MITTDAIISALDSILPDRSGVLLFGSQLTCAADKFSDVDVIAVSDVDHAYRKRGQIKNLTIDLHVHTENSLLHSLHAQVKARQWFYVGAFQSGSILQDEGNFLHRIKMTAAELAGKKSNRLMPLVHRFIFASLMGNAKRNADHWISAMIAGEIHSAMLSCFSLANRGWLASPAIMRSWLKQDDPDSFAQLDSAYLLAMRGEPHALLATAQQVLQELGGAPGIEDKLPLNF